MLNRTQTHRARSELHNNSVALHLLGDPSSNSPLVALPLTVCCLDGGVSSQSSSSSSTDERTNRLQTQNHFNLLFCFLGFFVMTQDWFPAKAACRFGRYDDLPEALEQHVVEFVFTERSGDSNEEGLPKQRRARVVISRLFVLFPQVHWDHYMVCILHSVHRHLKAAETHVMNPLRSRWLRL